jgi:hypothetical protein
VVERFLERLGATLPPVEILSDLSARVSSEISKKELDIVSAFPVFSK